MNLKITLIEMMLVLFLATTSFDSVSAVCSSTTKLYVDPPMTFARVGESFMVDVNVADVINLYSWQVNMSFNPDVLTYVNVTEGDFLKDQPEGTTPVLRDDKAEEGWVLFGWVTIGKYLGVSGNGTLATVDFRVAAIGESVINVTSPQTILIEINPPPIPPGGEMFTEIPYTAENGYFTSIEVATRVYVDPSVIRDPTLKPGSTFTVALMVSNVEAEFGCYSWQVNMSFDCNVLKYVNAAEGDFLRDQPEGTAFYYMVWESYVVLGCFSRGQYPGVKGNGTLATVEFEVVGIGESLIKIDDPLTYLLEVVLPPVPPGEDPIREILCAKEDGYLNNLPLPAHVEIYTDKVSYVPGEIMVVTLTVENPANISYSSSRLIVNMTWPTGDGMTIFDSGTFTLPSDFSRTVTNSIFIPNSMFVAEGTYIFTATLTYNGDTATDTTSFEIHRSRCAGAQ